MGIRLSFFGAAGEVTGSRHLLETGGAKILLDCGMFQGHRRESMDKNRSLPFKPRELAGVIVSHAHIDHTGGLPILAKNGLTAPIHCTRPTRDLCGVMLLDSAHLQLEDAKFFNKIHAKDGQRIEPLYDDTDAGATLALLREHKYDVPFEIAGGAVATLLNAGHILGSAMIQVDVKTTSGPRRILYTGDLGRRETLLMEPPKPPPDVDYLMIECTYGDRLHEGLDLVESRLTDVIRRIIESKGKLLIPSFALERTQEIVFVLEKLRRQGSIPKIPVYVDSPMAVNVSDIFRKHSECFCFDPKYLATIGDSEDPFGFKTVKYVRSVAESKALMERTGPMVILSASGMCEGGRILHHLRNSIDKPNTIVLIVGYQASGTLGRRLLDGADKVRIFGLEHSVRAKVEAMHSLSAHADRDDILAFIGGLKPQPRRIILVHGDPTQRDALAARLNKDGWTGVVAPSYGDTLELD